MTDSAGWKRAMDHADHDEAHGHDEHDEHETHAHDAHDHSNHRHPQEAYGISSVSYRSPRPLHPARFHDFFESLPNGIVRAKGTFWVAGRDDVKLEYGQAGAAARVEVAGRGSPAFRNRPGPLPEQPLCDLLGRGVGRPPDPTRLHRKRRG
nr:GTP-binding protein [Haladaptatus sp. W1]